MITFDEARTITIAKYYTEWEDLAVEPFVAEFGYENPDYWLMVVGPRDWIVGGDKNARIIDDAIYMVSKTTGELQIRMGYEFREFSQFTKYGQFPVWFD
jgi:hypothetical protein